MLVSKLSTESPRVISLGTMSGIGEGSDDELLKSVISIFGDNLWLGVPYGGGDIYFGDVTPSLAEVTGSGSPPPGEKCLSEGRELSRSVSCILASCSYKALD